MKQIFSEKLKNIRIPEAAAQILATLRAGGYEAYVVGGCIRDVLLGREPGDWDITTSALPQEVKALFPHTVDTGIQHGTVMVLTHGCGYEVTTYRIDGEYQDSRHPRNVTFTRSLEEDLKRRDFTINAFAWGEDGLIDLFGGLQDLSDGVIRCVGDPDLRFQEDALRIMRAVRFSAQLGFEIEEKTRAMICRHAPRLQDISRERIRVEWEKTLLSEHPDYDSLYADLKLAPYIIQPGFERCFTPAEGALLKELGQRRRAHINEEMYRQLLIAAAIMALSPEEADRALRNLKYDNKTRQAAVQILKYRNVPLTADRLRVKQAMNRMGPETWNAVLELADAQMTVEDYREDAKARQQLEELRTLTADILASGEAFLLSHLAVNGSDLIAAGIPAGKKIGVFLEKILQKVMQSPTLNSKDILCSKRFLTEVEHECKRGV